MANLILIKRSETAAAPGSLANGEMAWSGNSKVMFIGANGVVEAVGGRRYPGLRTANQALVTNATGMIDEIRFGNSTVNATVNATHFELANSTVTWSLPKPTAAQVSDTNYFLASDSTWKQTPAGATSIDGLSDVTITSAQDNDLLVYDSGAGQWENHAVGNGFSFASQALAVRAGTNGGLLANTTGLWVIASNGISVTSTGVNVLAGTNGGLVSNTTGVFGVAANGIAITAAGFNVSAGAQGGLLANTTGLWVIAGTGVTVNSTGVHIGQPVSTTSDVTFRDISGRDLTLSGNLTVQGTVVTVDATNMAVNDSIISLARNNGADSLDIGFYGQYDDGTERFTGLIWDTSADVYELFANTTAEPTTTVDTGGTGYVRAMLRAYLNTGAFISNSTAVTVTANSTVAFNMVANTLTLTTALNGPSGGTGRAGSAAAGDLLVGNSTSGWNLLTMGADGKVLTVSGTTVGWTDLDGGTY